MRHTAICTNNTSYPLILTVLPSAHLIAHLAGSREGLGMLDMDSPIWASDHFAVVADLSLVSDVS